MASGDLLGVSVSGALASQRALATTGHNIANANTEGYSRQRVDMGTRTPQLAGNGAIGTGVTVNNVERVYDDFVAGEVRTNTSTDSSFRANYEYTSQVDNLLSDPNAGLAPALQSFFSAVNGVSEDPSSTSARQVMLSEAQSLSDRFQYMHDRFDTLREGATAEMKSVVTDINDLTESIGKINDTIINAQEMSGQPPSDLLDQRDRMVQKLSELVSVRVSEQDDGRLNVFIGNGQTLVVGSEVSEMAIEKSRFDPNHAEIVFKGNASDSVITKFISGGRLGGILEFRNGVLDPAQNELGRIAVGITKTFNEQHRLGMDLESKLGENFFTQAEELAPNILPNGRNQGDYKISAEITDIDKLTTSDYELSHRDGKYRLVRMLDDKLLGEYDKLPGHIESEGFRINLEEGTRIANGDSFVIRPTRHGGEVFSPLVKNTKHIAAASPVRTEALVSNQGDAEISAAVVEDTGHTAFSRGNKLDPPFAIRFVDDTHYEILDNSGNAIPIQKSARPAQPAISANEKGGGPATPAEPAQPPELTTRIPYDPDKGANVFPTPDGQDYGFRVRLTGNPKAGDVFRIEFNKDGIGDNRNALELARLQSKPVLDNGSSDYSEVYSQLVSRVGSKTHELEINRDAQKLLLDQAIERKQAVSGVNLDEEAAKMVQYQNLYQANARVMATANKLLEELINAFR